LGLPLGRRLLLAADVLRQTLIAPHSHHTDNVVDERDLNARRRGTCGCGHAFNVLFVVHAIGSDPGDGNRTLLIVDTAVSADAPR